MTRKQAAALAFIQRFVAQAGYSPSYAEIGAGLNIKSKSGVHRVVVALERLGHLRRLPRRQRSLELVDRRAAVDDPAATPGVLAAATAVLDGIVEEDTARGVVTVRAAAIGALDVALAERAAEAEDPRC